MPGETASPTQFPPTAVPPPDAGNAGLELLDCVGQTDMGLLIKSTCFAELVVCKNEGTRSEGACGSIYRKCAKDFAARYLDGCVEVVGEMQLHLTLRTPVGVTGDRVLLAVLAAGFRVHPDLLKVERDPGSNNLVITVYGGSEAAGNFWEELNIGAPNFGAVGWLPPILEGYVTPEPTLPPDTPAPIFNDTASPPGLAAGAYFIVSEPEEKDPVYWVYVIAVFAGIGIIAFGTVFVVQWVAAKSLASKNAALTQKILDAGPFGEDPFGEYDGDYDGDDADFDEESVGSPSAASDASDATVVI